MLFKFNIGIAIEIGIGSDQKFDIDFELKKQTSCCAALSFAFQDCARALLVFVFVRFFRQMTSSSFEDRYQDKDSR
jgi:hypothetical protein